MSLNRRAVIFTGGELGYWALKLLRQDDYLIGADSGALFLVRNNYRPNLAIGDFDSVSDTEFLYIREGSHQTVAVDPVDKDHTDTELAFLRAIELAPTEILLVGALGGRLDHTLANLHLLVQAHQADIEASIADEYQTIRLVTGYASIEAGDQSYVSLLPLTPEVSGIHLSGFEYPLSDATLTMGTTLGISNRLHGKQGEIEVGGGWLLVIQSSDPQPAMPSS
ncbi:thiamine diphosphokinase [Paenibacillus sp. 1P07SE]|uniref:thiamine diphosphokinase n=1 Tax=Paenibacillus sp. 1P07SE TaxID=3132209 RepID=UPI0039A61508